MAQLVVRVPARHEVMGPNPDWSVTFLAENIPVLSGLLVIQILSYKVGGVLVQRIQRPKKFLGMSIFEVKPLKTIFSFWISW